jgi:hypothetical protein
MATVGRPPMYSTKEELQEKIDEYFVLLYVDDKEKDIIVHNDNTPTITGLVLFLGFSDRKSFYEYEKKSEFTHTIKRARMKIENWYEKCLISAKTPTGSIFALKNLGWDDKQQLEHPRRS